MKTHSLTQDIKALIEQSNKIALFGHRNADGDAIWSCLGLWWILEKLWKEVLYYTPDEPSNSFDFIDGIQKFKTKFDFHPHYDLLIFLDTADPSNMLGDFWNWHEAYFAKMTTLVIDHHVSNTMYAQTNLVDPDSIATCEIVTELLCELYPDEIDSTIATSLFLWLSTDSGHFTYEKDSVRTFESATLLLSKWADKKSIISHLYRSAGYESVKFMWVLIDRITKIDGVIYTYYRHEELAEYWVDKEKADSILGIMTRISHDGVFALVKIHDHESPPFLKASLRSKHDDVDVSKLAWQFWWWWHTKAAGLKTEISDNREKSLEEFVIKLS